MKKLLCIVLAVLCCAALFAGCGSKSKVTIGSKLYTENILLSEMVAQLIEAKTDIEVERKQALGGTSVCFPALEKGEIDMYVEYSGTMYNEILKIEFTPDMTADTIYAKVKQDLYDVHNVTIYEPIGLNNTYALGILEEKAAALNVKSMSDLAAAAPELIFGANHLFYTRLTDGYDGMVERYNLHFQDALKMDSSLLYDATAQGQVDVMVIYSTDALLKKYNMVVLEDDKQLFPPYHGTPIVKNETLKKYPALNDVLNLLAGRIDDARMQELNYQVDVEKRQVDEVAKEFLTAEGLL